MRPGVAYTIIEHTRFGPILHHCSTAAEALRLWHVFDNDGVTPSIIDSRGRKITVPVLERAANVVRDADA